MKVHSHLQEIIIFSLIILFCIIPPFFVTSESLSQDAFSVWNFPLQKTFFFVFSLSLYFYYDNKQISTLSKKQFFFTFFITLILLFANSFFTELISQLFIKTKNDFFQIQKPSDFKSILFCILNFLFSAFYEETIYRFYLSKALNRFCEKMQNNKNKFLICEGIPCVCFAFAHLYLGIFSVINAVIAHVILRGCYKKTNSIFVNTLVHSLYNITELFLLTII